MPLFVSGEVKSPRVPPLAMMVCVVPVGSMRLTVPSLLLAIT